MKFELIARIAYEAGRTIELNLGGNPPPPYSLISPDMKAAFHDQLRRWTDGHEGLERWPTPAVIAAIGRALMPFCEDSELLELATSAPCESENHTPPPEEPVEAPDNSDGGGL